MRMIYTNPKEAVELYRARANEEINRARIIIQSQQLHLRNIENAVRMKEMSDDYAYTNGSLKSAINSRDNTLASIKQYEARIELLSKEVTEVEYNKGEQFYTKSVENMKRVGYNQNAPRWTSLAESQRRLYIEMAKDI